MPRTNSFSSLIPVEILSFPAEELTTLTDYFFSTEPLDMLYARFLTGEPSELPLQVIPID